MSTTITIDLAKVKPEPATLITAQAIQDALDGKCFPGREDDMRAMIAAIHRRASLAES